MPFLLNVLPICGQQGQHSERMYNLQGDPFGKVLALSGTTDIQGKSVLLSSYSDDNVVRLWQLPDFTDRGHLNAIKSSIAVQCCQQYLFAGDYATGCVKVWKWKGS